MGSEPTTLSHPSRHEPYHRGLHILAWLVAIAAFPLIFMGGLVTSHGAGLAVPDWPNSFGYNMFALPFDQYLKSLGIFLEHSHRLLGSLVGFLAILLFLNSWRTSHRWLAMAVLGAVILQGVLGGLRVTEKSLNLAIIHGCVGQAVFCLMGLVVVRTSRWWSRISDEDAKEAGDRRARYVSVVGLGFLATGLVFAQLIVGAVMRHHQAGLAIPDLPLAYGHLLPPSSPEDLALINDWRMTQSNLGSVTLGQIHIHFTHRVGAVIVSIVLLTLVFAVLRRHRDETALRRPAAALLLLLLAQLSLGVLTVLLRKPADIATAHQAVGALVLVTTFVLLARALHLSGPADAASEPVRPMPMPQEQPA